jgi:PBP1b-binding outer membrane lipoprotein LpoB
MMKRWFPVIALVIVALFFVACSRHKEPAEAAIKAAE